MITYISKSTKKISTYQLFCFFFKNIKHIKILTIF